MLKMRKRTYLVDLTVTLNSAHAYTPIPLGYDPFQIEADLKIGTNLE